MRNLWILQIFLVIKVSEMQMTPAEMLRRTKVPHVTVRAVISESLPYQEYSHNCQWQPQK